jgi:hypothetical protein
MVRWLIVGLLIAGLAVGVWGLWPEDEPPPTTTTLAAVDTSTSASAATTTTAGSSTTTLAAHVVTTVEEAEAILADLWFGWFEGIYNQDEARIREVVGSESQVQAAVSQFGEIEFTGAPSPSDIAITDTEILLSTEDCLAVWAEFTISNSHTATASGVHVFRRPNDDWQFFSLWTYRDDLWEADCAAES